MLLALFDDLVRRINQAVGGERGVFIGVLDIFGFEIFETNSFEQLCINFTNERLQARFNEHTFVSEETTYREEGVTFERIGFVDNTPLIELISAKPYGVLNLLDEEVRMPQGGDEKYLAKIVKQHGTGKSKAFGAPGDNMAAHHQVPPRAFLIRHYAGDVVYSVAGLVHKNADRLSVNLHDMLAEAAADERTRALFPVRDKKAAGGKVLTVGEKFRVQLNKLMKTVTATQPYFIRCIKPNQAKVPNTLEMGQTVEQLQYAGVFEAVKIRKSGYPFRKPHADFAKQYKWIARKAHGWLPIAASPTASPKEYCQAVLQAVAQDFSNVKLGKTLVLYRAEEHRVLELLKNLALGRCFQRLQAVFRRRVGRQYRALLREAIVALDVAWGGVKDVEELGPAHVQAIENAMGAFHAHLGRFDAIFDFKPKSYGLLEERLQVQRELKLREAYLNEKGASLELHLCPLLRPAQAWAATGGGIFHSGKKERAAHMLAFHEQPIHEPLCQLERLRPDAVGQKKELAALSKELLAQYKNLLGFLGVKKSADPEALAGEWLSYGRKHPHARSELYVDLMKMLSDGGKGHVAPEPVAAKGWELLVASICHFAPPQAVADFVSYFVKQKSPQAWASRVDRLLLQSIKRGDAEPLETSCSVRKTMATHMPTGQANGRARDDATHRASVTPPSDRIGLTRSWA